MITKLGSIIGRPTLPFDEHQNLPIDDEYDTHMRSRYHEESGYGLNLDLLTISHKWSISYDSGLVKKQPFNTRLFKSDLFIGSM